MGGGIKLFGSLILGVFLNRHMDQTNPHLNKRSGRRHFRIKAHTQSWDKKGHYSDASSNLLPFYADVTPLK